MGYVSPDNVFMGLSELERQMGTLEALVAQERPQQREQWRRCVLYARQAVREKYII